MKRVMFFLFSVLFIAPAVSQTTLKNHKKGVLLVQNSSNTDSVVEHIIISLKEQAHSNKTGAIYDVKLLFPHECYRELINKTTGNYFFILVDCEDLHARRGMYFMRKHFDQANK